MIEIGPILLQAVIVASTFATVMAGMFFFYKIITGD
jgi:hypothetical protein